MIECLPRSICSWDFEARGLSLGSATLDYNWLTEQGAISWGGVRYAICKHGPTSGRWTLERKGEVVWEGRKPSAFSRRFVLNGTKENFELVACSPFSRKFNLLNGGGVVGTIQPVHPLTRRAHIRCDEPIPDLLQLFAFWLVGLTWRRSTNNAG